ncbi:unnamed protein product [Litomosoides sigmodontis]|uniref:Sodium/calcium exchanger membrane region domain-containing protein n=1 Tax=Litomosoides sigmodontis TaxID=42156 RepID=A0A3P6SB81_LITSI|nr:unnamed protein product [Litomosoides sigmodontis]
MRHLRKSESLIHEAFTVLFLFAAFCILSRILVTFHVLSAAEQLLVDEYSLDFGVRTEDKTNESLRLLKLKNKSGSNWYEITISSKSSAELLASKNSSFVGMFKFHSTSSFFPDDYFTLEQRRNGALLVHLFGLIYMFIAIAIVSDEFFVPSLTILTKKLSISDDVAGATFMAAGSSAPEFFTSLFGVFITQDNVGIGTILGSATFNILCVLAFCTFFSLKVLKITWWPMLRDISFYMLALLLLTLFFLDEKIQWYEAMSLFIVYVIYGIAISHDEKLEKNFEFLLYKVTQHLCPSVSNNTSVEEMMPSSSTISVRRKSSLLRKKTQVEKASNPTRDSNEFAKTSTMKLNDMTQNQNNIPNIIQKFLTIPFDQECAELKESSSEMKEPINISWLSSTKARLSYLFLTPVMLPLYYTLPDPKNASKKKYFIITFMGSILWIGFFSYLMVWWARVIGETLSIPDEIMGLTVLAAGTSVPDLITSVIVARKGLGDMAVSSSIGSNLFDICVGLPLPWLLQFAIRLLTNSSSISCLGTISVISKGLICSVSLLFLMLIVLIVAVRICRWEMNKVFGIVMIIAYVKFCLLSVLLELGYIVCPLDVAYR